MSARYLNAVLLLAVSCAGEAPPPPPDPAPPAVDPRVAEANAFAAKLEVDLRRLWVAAESARWDHATNINPQTEASSAAAEEQAMAYLAEAIPQAARYDGVELSDDVRRQLTLLKARSTQPAPRDPAKQKELATLVTKLGSMYASGKVCEGQVCRTLGDLEDVLATNRDPAAQLEAWRGWHGVSPPMRPLYQRFVELGNEGARDIGMADLGELWRSGYDMSPAELEVEVDRLWGQVKPLYEQLHCHVRASLNAKYGDALVPPTGPIPAHLTGNMWAQSWENLYPLLEPYPDEPSLDVTAAIKAAGYDELKMVRTAEGFFTSLGLDPLPPTFWERSLFVKPTDREVECHASAWDIGMNDDLRIKMCIKTNMEDLVTIHHELGHDYYYHYYHRLPVLYQNGANDGFHEAIGDAVALSITPAYLNRLGLLAEVSDSEHAVINKQLQDALAKVAFLPFGRMIDQWRWEVFSGRIAPEDYNAGWWRLREQYQGVAAPVSRSEADFDPGAKYHIPGNTPYLRYFLAAVLQFQFHAALCEAAGHQGPPHTCSVYGSKEAGEKLRAMLAMGASRPWPDALEAIAGTRQMDGGALVEYFGPLRAWLEQQNAGRTCGW